MKKDNTKSNATILSQNAKEQLKLLTNTSLYLSTNNKDLRKLLYDCR